MAAPANALPTPMPAAAPEDTPVLCDAAVVVADDAAEVAVERLEVLVDDVVEVVLSAMASIVSELLSRSHGHPAGVGIARLFVSREETTSNARSTHRTTSRGGAEVHVQ